MEPRYELSIGPTIGDGVVNPPLADPEGEPHGEIGEAMAAAVKYTGHRLDWVQTGELPHRIWRAPAGSGLVAEICEGPPCQGVNLNVTTTP